MNISFNFEIGRSRQKRSAVQPVEIPQATPTVEVVNVGTTVKKQPVTVDTPEQAMRLSTAFRCTDILSGGIASIPLQVKRKQNGFFSVDEDNELHELLARMPNPRMNKYDLICNAIIQMVNKGNAYIFIKRDFGDVSELILLANDSVFYDKYKNTYTVFDSINRISGTFSPDRIIHLKNKSLDGGYTGVSTIFYAATTFAVAASADNQNLETFQNGTPVKGIVTGIKGDNKGISTLNDGQISTVSQRINREFNNGVPIVALNGDMKFQQLSISPVDAQLLETKQFNVFEICRFYGVHPDKVFVAQSTNYKASEMSQVTFLSDTLDPILCRIEAEFNAKLIPKSVSNIYKIEFDRKALYKTDIATKSACMEKEIQYGVSTVNEWRIQEDRTPVTGGDTVFISCNVAPIDSPKIRGNEEKGAVESKNAKIEPPKNE
jgi:HK97 family phage portal protein|nr:MAG TPA: portal protein [Caudoviricetes sp.]